LLPGRKSLNRVIRILVITTVSLIITTSAFFYLNNYFLDEGIKRPEISVIKLNNFGSVTNDNIISDYVYTDKEIRKLFELIREYFDSYQDNLAMREINRLLLSNADNDTKEKVRLLSSYISIPDFSTLKTNFSYQDFLEAPKLYNNCYIHWKGRLSNLLITENIIQFDFLVGYDDKKILEGIIPVTMDFGERIDSDFPIEVLGKIVETVNSYTIEAVSVHQYQ